MGFEFKLKFDSNIIYPATNLAQTDEKSTEITPPVLKDQEEGARFLKDKLQAEGNRSHLYRLSFPDVWHIGVSNTWLGQIAGTTNATSLLLMLEDLAFDYAIMDRYQLNEYPYARFTEVFLKMALTIFSSFEQHEFPGHLFRGEEYGLKFKILPFDFLNDQRKLLNPQDFPFRSNTELGTLYHTTGGLEATQTASLWLWDQMLKYDADINMIIAYAVYHTDIAWYIAFHDTYEFPTIPDPDDKIVSTYVKGDVSAYWLVLYYMQRNKLARNLVNETGNPYPGDPVKLGLYKGVGFHYANIYAAAIFAALDPTAIFCAYHILRYLNSGEKFRIRIPDGLPIFNAYLSQNGPEYHVRVPIRINPNLIVAPGFRITVNTEGLEQTAGGSIELVKYDFSYNKYLNFEMAGRIEVVNQQGDWGALAKISLTYYPLKGILGIGGTIGGQTMPRALNKMFFPGESGGIYFPGESSGNPIYNIWLEIDPLKLMEFIETGK